VLFLGIRVLLKESVNVDNISGKTPLGANLDHSVVLGPQTYAVTRGHHDQNDNRSHKLVTIH
jgi:hypothetical protein